MQGHLATHVSTTDKRYVDCLHGVKDKRNFVLDKRLKETTTVASLV